MELLGRKFFYNDEQETFKKGFDSKLTQEQVNKVHLLRVSAKCLKTGVTVITSTWGRKNRAPAGYSRISLHLPLPNSTDKFKYADWYQLGEMTAEDMRHWIDNDEEFDIRERKAWSSQFNVWDTSEYWEVAQDLIDELVFQEAAHLGQLHWKVRATLSNLIVALIADVRDHEINYLGKKENLDLLEEIVQKSELSAQPKPRKKVSKAPKGSALHGD